eukprot:4727298-Pleurochrysis_carterae.AAC.2
MRKAQASACLRSISEECVFAHALSTNVQIIHAGSKPLVKLRHVMPACRDRRHRTLTPPPTLQTSFCICQPSFDAPTHCREALWGTFGAGLRDTRRRTGGVIY